MADEPEYFTPVSPAAADVAMLRRADEAELREEAERLTQEASSFLICLELAERVRLRLEEAPVAGWLYVALDGEGDDLAGWLEVASERLPGEEARAVVCGLWKVLLAEAAVGADKQVLLRKVEVLQRAAVAGLAMWRNMEGVVIGIQAARGWRSADGTPEAVAAEVVRQLAPAVEAVGKSAAGANKGAAKVLRMMGRTLGRVNRRYAEEDFEAMERLLPNYDVMSAAGQVLRERFGVKDPSNDEKRAMVRAFQRWKRDKR